jgi:hypothetical protein
VVGAEELPARGIDGGRRRWPRRFGEGQRGDEMWANKRVLGLHQDLRRLPERLAGDER